MTTPLLPGQQKRPGAKACGYLAEAANGPIPKPMGFYYPWGDALEELDRVRPDVRIVNLETAVTKSDG